MPDDRLRRGLPRWLRIGAGREPEAEMDREIDAHLQMRIDDLVRRGLTPGAARAEAERRFGDLTAARHRLRAGARQRDASLRQRDRLAVFMADVRFAIRQARRAPAFSALAIGTLALGLGIATTMFTLVHRVLLAPLPFPEPDRLVSLFGRDSLANRVITVSSADWQDWRRETQTLASTALHMGRRFSVAIGDSALRVSGELVTGGFFTMLGARFVAGRPFTEAEIQSGAQLVVVSEDFWRHTLGRRPLEGAAVRLGGSALAVVGVVADVSAYPRGTDMWFPFAYGPEAGNVRNNVNWFALGRLRREATIERATADLSGIARDIRTRDPRDLYAFGVEVEPLQRAVVGDVERPLQLLMGSVLVVVLVVCVNLGAANLARSGARAREMAIRTSLGAVRQRLVAQLLVEQIVLALAGGVLGMMLAWGSLAILVRVWSDQIPRAGEVRIDGMVFAFAFAISVLAGVLAGLAPAVLASRTSLRQLIASGGRGTVRGGRNAAGRLLVSAEIALALVLLAGATLLARSFQSLVGRDLGFDPTVTAAEIALPRPRYRDPASRQATWDALLSAFAAAPGVRAVGVANWIPLGTAGSTFIEIEGRHEPNAGAGYRAVSEDYFATLRIPVLTGRAITRDDGASGVPVAVINRRMAEQYWPGENPVGRQVRAVSMESVNGATAPWRTVVGVVGNVRQYGPESDPAAEMYVPFRQVPIMTTVMTVVLRGDLAPSRLEALARAVTRSVDPALATDIGTLRARLDAELSRRRLTMTLLAGFALLTVVLAALGVYGVLSYAVAQRARELAVRSALGARRPQLFALVSGMATSIIALGAAAGLLGAYWLSRALGAMLVDVAPADPTSYAWALLVLLAVAAVAVVVPAYRATQLDPALVLQGE